MCYTYTKYIRAVVTVAAVGCWLNICASTLWAQTASETASDEFLSKVFAPPPLVNTFGIGLYGAYKGSINTSFASDTRAVHLPTLNDDRTFPVVFPSLDYGVSFYAPVLFSVFGMNLDLGLSSYQYGTQYIFKNFLVDSVAAGFPGAPPSFSTNLTYITASPMFNFNGILVGAKIGIPLSGSVTLPNYAPLRAWDGSTRTLEREQMNTLIQVRVGGMLQLLKLRFGLLSLILDATYPLNNALTINTHPNGIVLETLQQANVRPTKAFEPLEARPLTISAGLSFLFTFNNAAEIAEFEREQKRTDSIRAIERKVVSRQTELSRNSARLADTITNTVFSTMQMQEKLAALEKARQDSIRRSLSTQLTTSKKELAKSKEELTETKKKVFAASIEGIRAADELGNDGGVVSELRVEQFNAKATYALLPYIFFDHNSSVIPSRYKRIAASARASYEIPTKSRQQPLALYYDLLNIIGKRLTQLPNARLTLIGSHSDTGEEKGNNTLVLKRIEAVSAYLQDVWRIPAGLIEFRAKTLPTSPSSSTTPEGQAENRRVELTSNIPELLEPVTAEFVSRVANPPALSFALDISSGAGLKQWALEIQNVDNQGAMTTLKDTSGGTTYPQRWIWWLNDQPTTIPTSSEPISARLEAYDINNQKSPDATAASLPVRQVSLEQKRKANQPDKILHFYELLAGTAPTETRQLLPSVETLLGSIATLRTNETKTTVLYSSEGAPVVSSLPNWAAEAAKKLGVQSETLRTFKAPAADKNLPEVRFYHRALRVQTELAR